MRDQSDSSSDLERARRISRGLCPRELPRTYAATGYVRLPEARRGPARRPLAPPPGVSGSWSAFLGWLREALGAEATFLTDTRGLLVGCSGEPPRTYLEDIGARVVVAFAQADQMLQGEESADTLSIQLSQHWITAFKILLEGSECLLAGVLTRAPLHPDDYVPLARSLHSYSPGE